MSNIIPGARPTRMELIALRRRRRIAEKGRDLLEEKRDALIMELFNFIGEVAPLRSRVFDALKKAYSTYTDAEMLMGVGKLRELSETIPDRFEIEVGSRSIIGVQIPSFQLLEKPPPGGLPPYGFLETTSKLDESTLSLVEALKNIVKLAEIEATLRRLSEAVITVRRRVNSLDYIMIPRIVNTIRFIEMHLEERSREDFFRLKRMKTRA
jgi:V/A-type H+-transporting ATPase subunit D